MLRLRPAPRRCSTLPRVYRRDLNRSFATKPSTSPSSKRYTALWIVGAATGCGIVTYLFKPSSSRAAPTKKDGVLSPTHFTPVVVTSTESCLDPTTRLLTLTVPPRSVPSLEEAAFQSIWSIYIKDDDIQVERPFTPLEGIDSEGRMKFWIKKYDNGEVGRWLHSKKPGDQIEIRGPLMTWAPQAGEWDEVVMISGGTGITPFCQLIHKELLSQQSSKTKTRYTLLHSSRRPIELPPSEMLEPLKAYSQAHSDTFRLSLFVDTLEGPAHPAVPSSSLTVGRIGEEAIKRAMGSGDRSWWQGFWGASPKARSQGSESGSRIMFLVCGPDTMVAAIAGPFGRNYSQGEVGGVLKRLGYDRGSVWKM